MCSIYVWKMIRWCQNQFEDVVRFVRFYDVFFVVLQKNVYFSISNHLGTILFDACYFKNPTDVSDCHLNASKG